MEYYGSSDPTQADTLTRALQYPSGTALLARVLRQGAPKENITETGVDGYGRAIQIRDPEATTPGAPDSSAVTSLTWDADHNVVKLRDPSGATSRWTYNPVSGYPTRQWDAEAVANGEDPTVLRYHRITTTSSPADQSTQMIAPCSGFSVRIRVAPVTASRWAMLASRFSQLDR